MAKPVEDNLELWSSVDVTDPHFTKGFSRGGGFKGTSTNATYLAKKATDAFGPVGIGWGYSIVKEEIIVGNDGTQVHKVQILFWYEWKGKRGEFTHFGQTEFSGKRNNGNVFVDEEAPKKSLTDAITKCLSLLGFAADVHLGDYDDNKYVRDLRNEFADEDEFQARRSPKNDNRRDDERGAKGEAETKAEPEKAKATTKSKASGKGAEKVEADAKSENHDENGSDEVQGAEGEAQSGDQMTDEQLVEFLKKGIDAEQSVNDVTDYMLHPDTVADLKSLPNDMAQDVKDYAKARLGELGFPVGKKKPA